MMKIKKIILFSLLVLLLLGVSYATEANNDTSTDTAEVVVKDTSTTTSTVDNSVKEETKINKEITKQVNINKTTKTATKTYDVTNFTALHNALTTSTYDTVNVNIKSNIKLTDNTELNTAIKKLTINGNGKTINGQNNYQFLGINNNNVTLKNLKIINCKTEFYGGAIHNNNGTLTIYNSTFNNNIAQDDSYSFGGAIYNYYGNLSIHNSKFYNNTAIEAGGTIYNSEGTITIRNSKLTNNNAYRGGAIYNIYGTLTIYNSTLNNNTAEKFGGALYTSESNYAESNHVNINDTTFTNNICDGGYGGAIYTQNDILYLQNNKFNNNYAWDGGAVFDCGSTVDIYNNTFTNNICGGSGGAIFGDMDSSITITKSTFKNNAAGINGGAINNEGTLTITNSTFNNNTATDGGAIYNFEGTLTIYNSTFNNKADSGGAINKNKADRGGAINKNKADRGGAINNYKTVTVLVNGATLGVSGLSEYSNIYASATKNPDAVYSENSGNTPTPSTEGTGTVDISEGISEFINNGATGEANSMAMAEQGTQVVAYSARSAGAIYNSGTLTIYNSTFNNNTARWDGGAIYNNGILTIYNSTFNNNTAERFGGAIRNRGTLVVDNTEFNNNTAEYGGGAIENFIGNNTKIINNNFINNSANDGAAILYIDGVNVTIKNNNFTTNKANTAGKAIINNGTNTTIKNNTGDDTSIDSSTIYIEGVVNTLISNNIFDDGRLITRLTLFKINNTQYGNNITIRGKAVTERNENLKSVTVTVQVNKDKYTVKTNSKGQFSITVTAKTTGKNNVTVTYKGNNNYIGSTNKTSFTVQKPVTLYIYTRKGDTKGSTIKVSGKLLYNNTGVKGQKIQIKVNNKTYTAKTSNTGYFTVNHTITDYKDLQVTYTYKGNTNYASATNKTTFTVQKPVTLYIYTRKGDTKGTTIKVSGKLLYNNNGIKGQTIQIKVNNKTYTVKTSNTGYFTVNHTITDYKDLLVSFTYNGNKNYEAVTNTTTYTVQKPVKLFMYQRSGDKKGTTIRVSGKLLYNNNGIKGQTIQIKVNNKTYTAKTSNTGYFTVNHTITDNNNLKVTFTYNGNKNYEARTNTTTYKVVA